MREHGLDISDTVQLLPLIDKYQMNGPRYTSYPTAPQFSSEFSATDYIRHALASNQDPLPRPLSLYLHIPYCKSLCYYCGCHKVIANDPSKAEGYLDFLYREIAMQSRLYDSDRFVEQIHLGGGTPTFLSNDRLRELIEALAQSFHFGLPSKMQMAIEIDPRSVTPDSAAELADIGFNRISLGIQDLDPRVQKAVNRQQSIEEIQDIICAVRAAGVPSISIDLMYGLPHQTQESFARTLDAVIHDIRPDNIALYNYAHLPDRIPAQRLIHTSTLPSPAEKMAIFLSAHSSLRTKGYLYLGMDHFTRPRDPLAQARDNGTLQRNFQGYSTHGDCDLIGLGVSAISQVNGCYSQNVTSMKEYRQRISAGELPVRRGLALEPDDVFRADIIQGIMCRGEVVWTELDDRHGIDSRSYFGPEYLALRELSEDGLVHISDQGFRVSSQGRFFLRPIAMIFDRYLRPSDSPDAPGLRGITASGYSKVF